MPGGELPRDVIDVVLEVASYLETHAATNMPLVGPWPSDIGPPPGVPSTPT
jgi:hypothetical protein